MQPSTHFLTALSKHLLNTFGSVTDGTFLCYRRDADRQTDGQKGKGRQHEKGKADSICKLIAQVTDKSERKELREEDGGEPPPSHQTTIFILRLPRQ